MYPSSIQKNFYFFFYKQNGGFAIAHKVPMKFTGGSSGRHNFDLKTVRQENLS